MYNIIRRKRKINSDQELLRKKSHLSMVVKPSAQFCMHIYGTVELGVERRKISITLGLS